MSECVLKTLACRDLSVGPSKLKTDSNFGGNPQTNLESALNVTLLSFSSLLSEGINWGMGRVMVGTAVFGAPRFLAKTLENTAFFHKKMQNRGAPKTAVPTTTHPIPQLTTSYFENAQNSARKVHKPGLLWFGLPGATPDIRMLV